MGQDHKVSARRCRCLSFPSLPPVTPSLLVFEGRGKAGGAKPGAPKPGSSGCPPPPTEESPPPPSSAYVPALAILSIPSGGAWGFRTPGSPRGFLQLGQPRPRPGSPAPPSLGSVPPGRACLAGRQSPQLSPGCPCSYLASPPLCAPSSRDLRFDKGAGQPPITAPPSPRDSEIGSHGLRGPSAARNSDTVQAGDPHGDWGVVPPTRGYREVGREQAPGRRVARVSVWSPSRCDRQGVPLASLPPAASSLRGSPSGPAPPTASPPQWYGPQPTL